MEFTADQVWGAAAAAHRINGGYFKEDQWRVTGQDTSELDKTANKGLVKKWLRENNFAAVTEEDYAAGRRYRDHFKSYTLLAIKGQLNDFQQQAFKIATIETFTGRMMLEFAIVSCLPSVAERDQDRTELKKEIYSSTQLQGVEGETIVGDLDVISCKWSNAYGKYKVNGRMGESFVDFWTAWDLTTKVGQAVRVKAKIKVQRGDKTTQLNYVKSA